MPFPVGMEKCKQEELTQCTQQAIEAIEALQEAISEVAKSKESWKRFFTAGKYIERMAEAKKRVETAIDLIQKHCIVDTKNEVLKTTLMLKDVWSSLTDMGKDVSDVKSQLEAGFAQMRAGFKNVSIPPVCASLFPHRPPPSRNFHFCRQGCVYISACVLTSVA